MKIEIGEYIRTRGKIGKLIRIERDDIDISLKWYIFDNGKDERYVNKPYIEKHSFNIIDLIEVGDYVNGYRIDNIINGVLVHRATGLDRSGTLTPIAQYNNQIKSIVTKEQFKNAEYRIPEEK